MSITEELKYELKHKGFKKYLAIAVFSIIILVFVFLGTYSGQQGGIGYAARVNNETVSIQEFRQTLDQMVNFYSQMFGGELNAEAMKRMKIRSAAMEQVVSRSAMVQAALNSGFVVSPLQVRDVITSIPAFQENGKFRRENYDGFLANRRLSAAQFEEDLKRDVVFGRVREAFEKSLTPASMELEKLSKFSTHKINLEFARIDAPSLQKTFKVDNNDAKQFLADQANLERTKTFFEANKSLYEKDEQVRARHILIKVEEGKSEAQALETINKVQTELKSKAFDVVAKEFSEDLGSKIKGGDLGFFSRGRMVKEFEDAAFSQEVGKIGEPIKSQFGYHIIKVEEKMPKVNADFEQNKIDVAMKLISEEKANKLQEQFKSLLTAEKTSEVNRLVQQLNLKWEETGSFSLTDETIPKLGSIDTAFQAAFAVSETKPMYKDIVSAGSDSYLVRFKSRSNDGKAKNADDLRQERTMARVRDAFSKWNDAVVKASKIERNAALIEGEIE